MVLTVISYIAIIASVIHLWKLRPFSNGVCVAITIGLLLLGWIGLVIYWIYFLVKRPDRIPVVQIEDSAQQPSTTEDLVPEAVNPDGEAQSILIMQSFPYLIMGIHKFQF